MNVIELARVWLWYLRLCLLFECNFQEDISIQLGLHAELIITRLTQIYFTSEHRSSGFMCPPPSYNHLQTTHSELLLSEVRFYTSFHFHRKFLHEMLAVSICENLQHQEAEEGKEPKACECKEMTAQAASKRNTPDFYTCAWCHSCHYKHLKTCQCRSWLELKWSYIGVNF